MPNWVYNRVQVTGLSKDLDKFKEHIKQEPVFLSHKRSPDDEHKYEGFSFHCVITPPLDKYEEYMTEHGNGPAGPIGNTKFNWYNFNSEAWGTKWDASNVDLTIGSSEVDIRFETAWSPPEPVFIAMANQWPTLEFEIWWEEEQGFGGEYQGSDGVLTETKTWDIPESHADYMAQDKECICSYYDDAADFFPDCPDYDDGTKEPMKLVEVTVKHVYLVKTRYEYTAADIVKAKENDFDLPNDTEFVSVQYDAGYTTNVLETYEEEGGE